MGIAGMVLGIVAIVFGVVPGGWVLSLFLVPVGLPLSCVGFYRNRKAGQGSGMSIAGMATNIVALALIAGGISGGF